MFEKYLKEIGLSEKEAEVYLALLQGDSFSILEIAKKTKINRTTIYPVIKSLSEKGLVSETTTNTKTNYRAESPDRLATFIERQKILLEENSKRMLDIIPQLKGIQRELGEKPVVKYFEGREGMVSSVEGDIFANAEPNEMAYMIYPKDLVDEVFKKDETSKFKKQRVTKKIKGLSIYTYKNGDIPSDETSTRIKIDGDKYPISCDISIYKDKVRIATLKKNLSAIDIQSADLAQTLKSLVRLIHDTLNK
ncbi:MAG: helix-turn-helix domain-containing protein [Candidatus Paceibacterota bacterium]